MAYDPAIGDAIAFGFDDCYLPRYGDDLYLGNAPYYPRRGDTLWFDFCGLYVPPAGDAIVFGKVIPGEGVAISVSFDLLAAMNYQRVIIADTGASVAQAIGKEFDTLTAVRYLPVITVDLDTVVSIANARTLAADTGAACHRLIIPAKPDFIVPWGEKDAVDHRAGSGWQDRRQLTTSIGMGWIRRLTVNAQASSGWATPGRKDNSKRATFNDYQSKINRTTYSGWKSKTAYDQSRRFAWDLLRTIDQSRGNSYRSPGAKDLFYTLVHDAQRSIDHGAFVIPWGDPPPKDQLHRTVWGKEYYTEICWRHYAPPHGTSVNFNIHVPISQVDDGKYIRFRFDELTYDRRCSWREPSGWRDAYFYIKPGLIPTGAAARYYIMINTASMTRLPERTPIEVSSITMSTDWDSVYWSVKAAVGSDTHLALLESTIDGPILIETAINGHVWNAQVDSWGTGQTFGRKSRSISGRSVSAQLGAPMADLRTRTETEARTASQLMNVELENTGWTAVIAGDDWLVPANTFSYADQTPMQIIKTIADAAGAMVYTDQMTKTITVKPRYPVAPWQWAATTAGIVIPSSMVERLDGEWDERPFYNAAFVSGEGGGISAKILREGSAGDIVAPMVTDQLITATEVARARGISILGASGKWSKHRMELPLFQSPDVPGVILPGTLLQFVDGLISWKGITTSVSVTAAWGSSGLKVRQTIDVERYHGN